MRNIDSYKHLNEDSKFIVQVDIEDMAAFVVSMNYGVHRLLSAIVHLRLAKRSNDELALGILALLEKGLC